MLLPVRALNWSRTRERHRVSARGMGRGRECDVQRGGAEVAGAARRGAVGV